MTRAEDFNNLNDTDPIISTTNFVNKIYQIFNSSFPLRGAFHSKWSNSIFVFISFLNSSNVYV